MDEIISNFGIDWRILIAEVFNFLIIIAILYFFVFKRIFVNLDKRREIIANGVKKSELAEETLKNAKKKRDEIIVRARAEANDKIKKSIDIGKEKESVILKKAKNKADEIIESGKSLGERQKNSIILSADKEIAKLAILGVEKILIKK